MEAPRAAEPAAGKADDLQAIVTRNIRVAMALRGVNQKDLAKVLGIATSSMSQKFTGKTLWNLVDIEKASGFFNVKPEALVAGHGFEPCSSGNMVAQRNMVQIHEARLSAFILAA